MENVTADFIGQNINEKVEGNMEYAVNPMHKSVGLDIRMLFSIKIFSGDADNQQGV